jgi:hypothetical protein
MHEVAGMIEVAALKKVTPVLEVAAIRPVNPKASVEVVEKGLACRRVEERVYPSGKPLGVLCPPAHCLLVKVYFTE